MIKTPLQRIEEAIIISALLLLVVITLQPILNLLAISLSDSTAVPEMSGLEILPTRPSTDVWGILMNHPAVQRGLWNSFIITSIATVLNVIYGDDGVGAISPVAAGPTLPVCPGIAHSGFRTWNYPGLPGDDEARTLERIFFCDHL